MNISHLQTSFCYFPYTSFPKHSIHSILIDANSQKAQIFVIVIAQKKSYENRCLYKTFTNIRPLIPQNISSINLSSTTVKTNILPF